LGFPWEKVNNAFNTSDNPHSFKYRNLSLLFWLIGAFGNVRVGWSKNNKHVQYAIKTMKKAEIINSKHVDHIENEKRILEKIQHPFIVRK
jgi:serine/threonine protein kinase